MQRNSPGDITRRRASGVTSRRHIVKYETWRVWNSHRQHHVNQVLVFFDVLCKDYRADCDQWLMCAPRRDRRPAVDVSGDMDERPVHWLTTDQWRQCHGQPSLEDKFTIRDDWRTGLDHCNVMAKTIESCDATFRIIRRLFSSPTRHRCLPN